MCCARLAGNAGPKRLLKSRHLGTTAQLCRPISSQLRHVSIIRKKLVKQQCLPYMSSKYGELRPSNGWDWFGGLGHPLGVSQSAALNTGRHLYLAGQPSRWALVHILVTLFCKHLSHVDPSQNILVNSRSCNTPVVNLWRIMHLH